MRGLNAFTRMSDGRMARGPLYAAFKAAFSLDADLDLCAKVMNAHTRGSIAALSQFVTRAANDGDAAAIHILNEAARELVVIVEAVRQALQFEEAEPVPVSYSGGVFHAGAADPRTVPAPSGGAIRQLPRDRAAAHAVCRRRDLCRETRRRAALGRGDGAARYARRRRYTNQ